MCETGWAGVVGKKEGKKHRQHSEQGGGVASQGREQGHRLGQSIFLKSGRCL